MNRRSLQAACGAMLLGALGTGAGAGCSSTATCADGDLDCVEDHLRIYDAAGNPLPLVKVPGTSLQGVFRAGPAGTGTGAPPPGPAGAAPRFTRAPPDMEFADSSSYVELELAFTDPTGHRPGGCFRVHQKNTPPGPFSGFLVATPPVDDGAMQGTWVSQLGFEYAAPADAQFSLDFYAFAPIMGGDAMQALAAGSPVLVSPPVTSGVKVDAASGRGSSGGSTGGTSGGNPGGGMAGSACNADGDCGSGLFCSSGIACQKSSLSGACDGCDRLGQQCASIPGRTACGHAGENVGNARGCCPGLSVYGDGTCAAPCG